VASRAYSPLRGLFELAVTGVALFSAGVGVACQLGRWVLKLDILTHGAVLWLGVSLLALVLSAFFRRGWGQAGVMALALIGVASAASLIGPEFTRPRSPLAAANAPCQIKIVSFNAWGENADAPRAAAWIAAQHPSLVVVVEPSEELRKRIAAATGLATWMGDGALMANATPFLSNQRSWAGRFMAGSASEVMWDTIEVLPDLPVTVLGVHAGWPIPARAGWSRDVRLAAILEQEDRPSTLMVGDFNSSEWSFRQRRADAMFAIERRDRAILSWPARIPFRNKLDFPFPWMPIDHVYAGENWRLISIERGPRLGSDHYPLVTRLAWVGPVRSERMRQACAAQSQ
jgi:endonuclease/exonuclease/phosphatase (EEP) superfamily protein YafD